MAVTIDLHRQRREVNVRTCRLQNDGTIGEQLVTVSEEQSESAHVDRAPLVIPFRDLVLRDPTGNETDTSLTMMICVVLERLSGMNSSDGSGGFDPQPVR